MINPRIQLRNLRNFIWRKRSYIYIDHLFNDETITEKCRFTNNRTIKSKYGLLLSLVKPSHKSFKGNTISYYRHHESEIFVRNAKDLIMTDDNIKYFILSNKLYTDVTDLLPDNWQSMDQIEIVDSKKSGEKAIITKDQILQFESNRAIVPFRFDTYEYLRYESSLFEESQIMYQLIKAMKRDAKSQQEITRVLYAALIFGVLVIFFMNGGIQLIKFW